MSRAPLKVTLLADYVAWPVWGPNGPMGEDDLPLSDDLKQRIRAWFRAWDEEWAPPQWPVFRPPPKGSHVKRPKGGWWKSEGAQIVDQMRTELGPKYAVTYQP